MRSCKTRAVRVLLATTALSAFAGTDESPQGLQRAEWRAGSSRDLPPEPALEEGHLLGGMGGARDRLLARGIHLKAGYIGEVLGNIAGGLQTGAVYEGLAQMALDLDLERLLGWGAATFRASGIYPHGESPSVELTGDLQGVSNIDAFRDDPVPYEVWLEQGFADGTFSVRAGLLVADTEFAFTDAGGVFLNAAFGWPSGISLNTLNTGPAYFRSALGGRLRVEPEGGWYAQGGIYDGDTFDGAPLTDSALDFNLGGDDGIFSIAETGYAWNEDAADAGLPGEASIGGWFHTAEFPDHVGVSTEGRSRGGVFVTFEQLLWRCAAGNDERQRTVTAFARAGWAPPERSLGDWCGDAGLVVEALLPSRFQDSLGVGVAWLHLSEDFRRAAAGAGGPMLRAAEVALEVTWSLALRPGWTVQPDYQWIQFVGGDAELDDAHVLGLRTQLSF